MKRLKLWPLSQPFGLFCERPVTEREALLARCNSLTHERNDLQRQLRDLERRAVQ